MIPTIPLVSVITPSFNRDWIIQSCIDSIFAQGYSNIEQIIVDACSTDETANIVARNREAGRNIRWISEPDKGMYDAINKGIRAANGDIIAYLNTDDFYFPYTVATVVNYFIDNPSCDIVYGDWLTWHLHRDFLEVTPTLAVDRYDMARFARLPQPAVFMRRGVFEQYGLFDPEYTLLADNAFFARCIVNGAHCRKIDEILAGQIVHADNLLAGNQDARAVALKEESRYRQLLLTQLRSEGITCWMPETIYSLFRQGLLCLTWRLSVIHFVMSVEFDIGTKWPKFRGLLSKPRLKHWVFIKYIFSRQSNNRHTYFVVDAAALRAMHSHKKEERNVPNDPLL